jgi:hypothetical protein
LYVPEVSLFLGSGSDCGIAIYDAGTKGALIMAGNAVTDTNSAQYQIESQAAQALSAIPVVGGILSGIAGKIVGIFAAHHLQAVKVEAQTMSAAVPAWRTLLSSTVTAYNSGEIDATSARAYIEDAKALYYQQVKSIERGTPNAGGVGATHYYESKGRFAPIDPCNAACYVGYYFVEPEAQLIESAINSGQSVSVNLLPILILNTGGQGGAPAMQLQVSPPFGAGVLPSALEKPIAQLEASVKSNPLLWGAVTVIGIFLVVSAARA